MKCFTTALVGGFLFAYGLAFYLVPNPSVDVNEDELDPWIYLYFILQLFLTISGTYFQLQFFGDQDKIDDNFYEI